MDRDIFRAVGWVERQRNPAQQPSMLGFIAFNPAYGPDSLIKIFVDGKPLKGADGGELTLVQGSSIYLRGKIIGVQVTQGISSDRNFGGELKIVAKSG